MMPSIIFTLVFAVFIIIDLVPLFREKRWKSFWTYAVLLSAAYILQILIMLDIKIPSPAIPIKNVVSAIFGLS